MTIATFVVVIVTTQRESAAEIAKSALTKSTTINPVELHMIVKS
jgi:hypothetical protein